MRWILLFCLFAPGCRGESEAEPASRGTESITLSTSARAMVVGETIEIFAIAHAGRGAVTVRDHARWTVEPGGIARMERPGFLRGLRHGRVTVQAEVDGVTSNPLTLEVLHVPPPR